MADVLELFHHSTWTPFTSLLRHDSWNTTQWLVDLILQLWPAGIDCDPCSNETSIVPARTKYDGKSPESDGLLQTWRGAAPSGRLATAFSNCPYSDPSPWYERAAHQALKAACEVLLLVNVTTSTKAWNRFRPRQPAESFEDELELCRRGRVDLPRSSAVGFFNRRIAFLDAGVPIKSNEYEQMILYWGPQAEAFREVFMGVAWCPGGEQLHSVLELQTRGGLL